MISPSVDRRGGGPSPGSPRNRHRFRGVVTLPRGPPPSLPATVLAGHGLTRFGKASLTSGPFSCQHAGLVSRCETRGGRAIALPRGPPPSLPATVLAGHGLTRFGN